MCAFDEFGNAGKVFEEPTFVWAHIMLPHPPWIFGPNGEEITPGKPLVDLQIILNLEIQGGNQKFNISNKFNLQTKKLLEVVEKILER